MKLLSLLGVAFTTLLTGCNPPSNRVLGNYHRFNVVGDTNQVNFSLIDDTYRIDCLTNSGNLAYHRFVAGSSRFSYTFVFDNRVQTIIGDEFSLSNMENIITTNNFSSYYYGFYDKASWYTSGTNTYRFYFQRYYFVNPVQFGLGTYYIDDKTWSNIYDYATDSDYYGGWQSLLNFISSSGFYVDDSDGYLYLMSDGGYFTLYSLENIEFIEPQRHYGNTFTLLDGDSGQNLNETHYSFLPYFYCFCDYEQTIDQFLSDITSFVYIEFYKSSALDSYLRGFNEGYESGYDEGVETGTQEGYSEGYSDGNSNGYVNGFNAGSESANTYTFPVLFGAIADTPVLIFRQLFNFDLFGTPALVIVMSLLTAIALIYVFKRMFK